MRRFAHGATGHRGILPHTGRPVKDAEVSRGNVCTGVLKANLHAKKHVLVLIVCRDVKWKIPMTVTCNDTVHRPNAPWFSWHFAYGSSVLHLYSPRRTCQLRRRLRRVGQHLRHAARRRGAAAAQPQAQRPQPQAVGR